MNQLLSELQNAGNETTQVVAIEAVMAILLSFMLSGIVTWVYKKTHKGQPSQSFIHTIMIMSVVVSVVMIVIGNNIAVAFGLVGAFSIIRFRTAMGDPKDIAFIFAGMAAGIACGLGFYLLAFIFTVILSALIFLLFTFDYGKADVSEKTLKVTIPENMHYEKLFDGIFSDLLDEYNLVQVETTNLGTMYQLTYKVKGKEGVSDQEILDAVREHNANLKVSIVMSGMG
ncbi:DUF4956 domain-containing protein [Bacillus sp. H-16]|uniref:DUF4956 domain-containing protein n=1 Tax=Alteribacter salitolerans TaxID=2912333 RepID=UPI0019625E88|nr:DUF4956 domain-containing protein [Alteribacter salitolerans]MBM7096685.1 DUF4956 domain-containing protein [Alteribacter salitolerans]